jgi:hypothetical protein
MSIRRVVFGGEGMLLMSFRRVLSILGLTVSVACTAGGTTGGGNAGAEAGSTSSGGTLGGNAAGGSMDTGGTGVDEGGASGATNTGGVPGGMGGTGTTGTNGTTGGAGGTPMTTVVVPPPVGKVPMFVAAGHGARTVTSCDDGRTWIANHAYENQNVDHSPYTEKGFVYGNGRFVLLIGWGAPTTVKVSDNGINWTQHAVSGGGGGIAYLDMPSPKFITIGGYGGCQSSTDGKAWNSCKAPSYNENLREAGGGAFAMGGGGDIPATFSFDGGNSWRTAGACSLTDGFGNLGQEGGFAYGNDMFVAISSRGDWCKTANKGVSWQTGKLPGTATGKLTFAGDRFWAPNGNHGFWTQDGETWKRETFAPSGTTIHAIARSDKGTYVGIQRQSSSNRYYRSQDGINWTLVSGPGGTELRRVAFGYGSPSAQCPLP